MTFARLVLDTLQGIPRVKANSDLQDVMTELRVAFCLEDEGHAARRRAVVDELSLHLTALLASYQVPAAGFSAESLIHNPDRFESQLHAAYLALPERAEQQAEISSLATLAERENAAIKFLEDLRESGIY
ncbi:MAG: hypothetical protein K0Q68_294 [Moraxellaceae bacterium]|jgi:hypothetical protein|nr:hypothetical protein [Moraxellaceae bacterium]